MDIFSAYAVNDDAEEQGVWVPNGDVEFLIARQGNSRHMRMMTKVFEANKHLLELPDNASEEATKASEALNRRLMNEVSSKSILLGWRGRKVGVDADGKDIVGKVIYKGEELPFSAANGQLLLAHKDFANWVATQASKLSLFLESAQEKDEKNSVSSSSGTSSGETSSTSLKV